MEKGPGDGQVLSDSYLGAPGEIRTPNLRIRSAALYPLSYGGMADTVSLICEGFLHGFYQLIFGNWFEKVGVCAGRKALMNFVQLRSS